MIDIYHSRRTKFERCPYFVEQPDRDLNEWVLKEKPSGIIYCQPVQNRNMSNNPINNVMLFSKNTMCLLTNDECDDLKTNSIILYRGHPWIVTDLSKELHLKQSEFGHDHYDIYIYIRRG